MWRRTSLRLAQIPLRRSRRRWRRSVRVCCWSCRADQCPWLNGTAVLTMLSARELPSERTCWHDWTVPAGTRTAPWRSTGAILERVASGHGLGLGDAVVRRQRGHACSKHGLHIRSHHLFDSGDASIFEKLFDRQLANLLFVVAQCPDRNVQSDLVSVFEAIHDGSLRCL